MSDLIHSKMCALMADVGSIGKDARNTDDGFDYRSVEQVCQKLQPLLVKHELYATCEIISQETVPRSSVTGSELLHSTLRLRYTIYAADGSCVSSEVVGEGIDPGDKASNKAMSVAYKYFWCQLLCIPYGSVDPDAVSHKTAKPKAATTTPPPRSTPQPPQPPKTKAPEPPPSAYNQCCSMIDTLAEKLSAENVSKSIAHLKAKLAKNQLSETQCATLMKRVDALAAKIPKDDLSKSLMLRIETAGNIDTVEAIREEVAEHHRSENINDIELKQFITAINAVLANMKE